MVHAITRQGTRAARRATTAALRAIALLWTLVLVLSGCTFLTTGEPAGSATPGVPPTSGASATPETANSSPFASDPVTDAATGGQAVSFEDLLDDPARFIGRRIEVAGRAFFVARCPPPGDAPTACVLQGYLAHPDRGVFIASDVTEAIALAEDGRTVSCEETAQTPTACANWTSGAAYAVVGVVERQVAGGRELDAVQLNVISKTDLR
jgi:hypothetical protein